jgi:(E)-4-hydroxy-3-methylbut-2-enyl-diphosphate synthase
MGMVESAMEFLRIARDESYHQIVLSMKSSNPLVMVQAYRLLVHKMQEEFGICYPLHIGVTEAGDGEDGRIKSAIGIGTLLEDGIGDTIRVSLTEDPEFEIPVCRDIVARYGERKPDDTIPPIEKLPYSPFEYKRRVSHAEGNIGVPHPPVVIADLSRTPLTPEALQAIGYRYEAETDKWNISDAAADYIYTAGRIPGFALPGTLKVICDYACWRALPGTQTVSGEEKYFPLFRAAEVLQADRHASSLNFVLLDTHLPESTGLLPAMQSIPGPVLCVYSSAPYPVQDMRRFIADMMNRSIDYPVILRLTCDETTIDKQLIHFAVESGALLTDGLGDGLWLLNDPEKIVNKKVSGRTYLPAGNNSQFLNNTAFSILQAARTRISKTEYISCPSCGRTLFDLQETTAKIRSVTGHLKGLKIAVMGCIVNGPGEMADADFGYVGSGPGKITLYKGKEVMKRAVPSEIAVEELINLLKENNEWIEPGEAAGS